MHTKRHPGWGRRTTALAVAGLLGLTACGGDDDKKGGDAAPAGSSAQGGDAGTTTTVPGGGGRVGSDPPAGGPGQAPGAAPGDPGAAGSAGGTGGAGGPTTTAAPKTEVPVTLTVAHDCVRPGTPQTLTVQTLREIPVGYTVKYADGKTSMDAGYHGGIHGGKSDKDGRYESTWQVGPAAPAGPATVTVLANHPDYKPTRREITFQVSNATGRCG